MIIVDPPSRRRRLLRAREAAALVINYHFLLVVRVVQFGGSMADRDFSAFGVPPSYIFGPYFCPVGVRRSFVPLESPGVVLNNVMC